jgi:hypothetical protein
MSALELSIKGLKDSIEGLKYIQSNADISSSEYYDDITELYENIDSYSVIIIVVEIETIETKERSYFFTMTDKFKECFKNFYSSVINNDDFSIDGKIEIIKLLFKDFFRENNLKLSRIGKTNNSYSKINYVKGFKLANIKESSATGGKKRVVKQTVKELQAIAVENNIKITKKVEGKTVRLNKKGLIAKLKRYKLI